MKILTALSLIFSPAVTWAHVKWFSGYDYNQPPLGFAELNHTTFWLLLLLTVVTIGIFTYANHHLEGWKPYQNLNQKLEAYSGNAALILRIFTGGALLLAWENDAMIAPELKISEPVVGWLQFFLALLMLGARTSALAGAGMIGLYFYAMSQYGFFHMLDYLVFAAIGFFLLVSPMSDVRIRGLRVPALYMGLGFSLCWAALEKIYYPTWGLEVLQSQPALTMGLEPRFFLLACAFIEFALGYLLIIGILQRPLALTITLVFFTTSAFFGKTEVVGHTIIHGALLVFIVMGPGGYFRPPILWHQRLPMRVAFACVNFLIVGALLGIPYYYLANDASAPASAAPVEGEENVGY